MVERGECGDERKRKRGEVIEGNGNAAERGESCGRWKEGSVITPLTVVSMHCHRQRRVKVGDERKRKRGEVIDGNQSNAAERGELCGWWKEGSVGTKERESAERS